MRRVSVPPNLIHLPFVERAWIPEERLAGYVLNPEHHRGRHKARRFAERLGIRRENSDHLRQEILGKLPDSWVRGIGSKNWIEAGAWQFATEWEVHVQVDGLNGQSCPVLTGWHLGSSCAPKLSTARVLA
jgi:hypothetical protein